MNRHDMQEFVARDSVVRKIWGHSDTVLLIFAGAAAEFSLNKAVDWLYFTGRLPADPIGRLFSTVSYARNIVFSPMERAHAVIDRMTVIHSEVEQRRNAAIPPWAYRDVLYMLIDYSIRSFELLHRPLLDYEKAEVFNVFQRVGLRMQIPGLPETYTAWVTDRAQHMDNDLDVSPLTHDLYRQYRYHLGWIRFRLLLEVQALVVPSAIRQKLKLGGGRFLRLVLPAYKWSSNLGFEWLFKRAILPAQYVSEVRALDKPA